MLDPDSKRTKSFAAPPAAPAAAPAPGEGTVAQNDAFADIKAKLAEYGLPASLAEWAWQELVNGNGESTVLLDLYERPEFHAAFPEIKQREQNGLPPISPAAILEYRQRGAELAKQAGLPQSFYDKPEDFSALISNGVSFDEFASRVRDAQLVAFSVPADVRDALKGVLGVGDFTALAFDPTAAVPVLERKIKEAEVVAGAARGGYALDAAGRAQVTDYLAGQQPGQSADALGKAFGDLTQQHELFVDLSGTGAEGGAISQQEQLSAAVGGNAGAQRRIADRAARRKASFQGSAGYAASQAGVSGLGAN